MRFTRLIYSLYICICTMYMYICTRGRDNIIHRARRILTHDRLVISPYLKSYVSDHKTRYHIRTTLLWYMCTPLSLYPPLPPPLISFALIRTAYLMHLETEVRIRNSLLALIVSRMPRKKH